jgi:hypothetical protein
VATVLEDAANLIRTRLDELGVERDKLERALAELGGSSASSSTPKRRGGDPKGSGKRRGRPLGSGRKPGPKPASPPAAAPAADRAAAPRAADKRRRKAGKRTPKAEREATILAFIKDNPTARVKAIASGTGMKASYVKNLLSAMRKNKTLVRRDGKLLAV